MSTFSSRLTLRTDGVARDLLAAIFGFSGDGVATGAAAPVSGADLASSWAVSAGDSLPSASATSISTSGCQKKEKKKNRH